LDEVDVVAVEGMSKMAVEHGRARCPRCMAWAEYQFLERGHDKLEYEVRCADCGHVHSEVTVVPTATPAAA
jgi:uncharacterized Zn finger protein